MLKQQQTQSTLLQRHISFESESMKHIIESNRGREK